MLYDLLFISLALEPYEITMKGISEKADKIKQKILTKKPEEKIESERIKFICLNNGCNKEYVQNHNGSCSCHYHPFESNFFKKKEMIILSMIIFIKIIYDLSK